MGRDFVIWGTPISHQAKRRQTILEWQEKVASAAREAIAEEDKIVHADFSLLLIIFHVRELPADLDNLAKCTLDGMSTIAFGDDRQIAQLTLRRTPIDPDLAIDEASPVLYAALGQALDQKEGFVYVRLGPPPDPRRLP